MPLWSARTSISSTPACSRYGWAICCATRGTSTGCASPHLSDFGSVVGISPSTNVATIGSPVTGLSLSPTAFASAITPAVPATAPPTAAPP